MEESNRSAELAKLVAETYDLIEQNAPAVDVARLRRIFDHARVPV